MDPEDLPLVPRRALAELLYVLNDTESLRVLLLGDPGIGKTSLLRMVEEEMERQGRAAFFVSCRNLRYPGELGNQILKIIAASAYKSKFDIRNIQRTLRSSAGAPPLREAAAILLHGSAQISSPTLLLDDLDESTDPPQIAAAVEELSLYLEDWRIIVSSRPTIAEIRRFSRFRVLQLRGFDKAEADRMIHEYSPYLPRAITARIIELANGNPLLIRILAEEVQRSGSLGATIDAQSLATALSQLVNEAISTSPNPAKLTELLEELALAGGRERITSLALKLQITEREVWSVLGSPRARALLLLDDSAKTAALFHSSVRDVILSQLILTPQFRLADLEFGAEEAEKDELLDVSFVQRPGMEAILDQRRSIIIGDRGSGKSAIFRKLAAGTTAADDHKRIEIYPVANPGDLLHRIADKDVWLDADALRAAWLVVVASVVASTIPATAPRKLRHNAADLRAAFGMPNRPISIVRRALRAPFRLLGGTTLTLAVGPVSLKANLPSDGTKPSKASVNVESFLEDADGILRESRRRAIVMFDRIDETFKYDRAKQEAVVQALLQAEGRMSLSDRIGLVVFLRTDLFELYDIQEKNKLVSRTLTLDWSEEEWLQVLARRVLANEPFQRLAKRLQASDGTMETRSALEVLFPSEIEGQPVDRWLIDSLRNGNGDISPRLAVLLLHLVREFSARPEDVVSTLPLFSAEAVGKAMTRLSDLSFSEVVNDFKVAPSFVRNCRAGKLETFTLPDVETLFDQAEGKISEQVGLLERLGFLERIVEEGGSGLVSRFRIPKLYTRCWDHA